MKQRLSILLAAIAILLLGSVAWAAQYRATYTVLESSGNDYTMLAVSTPAPNTWMAANGFMQANALDTRVETLAGAPVPHMVASDRTLAALALPADSQSNLFFTTDNSDLTSMDIITGYDGYVTVTDAAALEPGNNFEFLVGGWLDTSTASTQAAPRHMIRKQAAFRLYPSATNTLTASIMTSGSTSPVSSASDGHLLKTDVAYATARTTATADSATAGATDFFIGQNWNGAAYEIYRGFVYIDTSAIPDSATITSATLRLYGFTDSSATDFDITIQNGQPARPSDPLVVGDYDMTFYSGAGGAFNTSGFVVGAYNDITLTTTALTWISLTGTTKLALRSSLDIAGGVPVGAEYVRVRSTDAGAGLEPQLVVNYEYPTAAEVSATVTSGEYVVRVTADTTDLKIFVDGVQEDTIALGGASVPNNANDWIILANNTVPYADHYKQYVAGVPVLLYQPNDIVRGQAYSTGSVTVTNGSTAVVGAGGATWTSGMVGSLFRSADGVDYVVASVTDATNLVLATAYGGATLGGQAYNLYVWFPNRGTGIAPFSGAADGTVSNTNADYTTAHNAATGVVDNASATFDIGQWKVGANTVIYRAFTFFNTAPIPDDAVIQTATLRLYGTTNGSTTDFDIVIQDGTFAGAAIADVDYEVSQFSGNGGSFNTSSFAVGDYNDISLNATGMGWINLTGTTVLALRSSRDISSTAATGAEYVAVSSTDAAGPTQDPILEVTYIPNPAVNNGAITWGTNPAGVTVTLGLMQDVTQPVPGASVETPVQSVLLETEVSDWFQDPAVAGALLTNPMRPLVTMVSDNTTLTEMQTWRLYGLIFVIAATVLAAGSVKDHLLIAGIAMCGAIVLLVAFTIWPIWALVFALGGLGAGVMAERMSAV